MKHLLALLILASLGVACSSSEEKYEKAQAEAKADYKEDLKEAEEEYGEDSKEEAEEMVEDADSVKIDEENDRIEVED